MGVVGSPLFLTLLAGGLGPTSGQREWEQAWVSVTTADAFVIQLTLRGGLGPEGSRAHNGHVTGLGLGYVWGSSSKCQMGKETRQRAEQLDS